MTLLADLLTGGVDAAVASRVTDYLGRLRTWRLRRRRWDARGCQELAETARIVLGLKQQLHEVTGNLVSRALPPQTPDFHRELVKRIAAKVPLPPDAKLEALARGLQIIGIFKCMVEQLPMSACACLSALGEHVLKEQVKHHVQDLLQETRQDLAGLPP